jgi:hypothetical protein
MMSAITRFLATTAVALSPLALAAQADTTAAPQPPGTTAAASQETLPPGTIRVRMTFDGGSYIALEDGSLWETYLPDRTSTDEWRPGDVVELRLRPIVQGAPTGLFEYELVNGATRSTAAVRFAGTSGGRE